MSSSFGSKNKVPIESISEILPSGSIDLNIREDGIESWPASKTLTPRLTTNKSIAFLKFQNNANNVIKNLMTNLKTSNKPLLLLQIEEFIQYELNRPINRRNDRENINESRLEIFRECFDVLISEFSTYQPVLTQIKNEYENVIAQCLKKVHGVRLIETKLATLEKESKDKIKNLEKTHLSQLENHKNEIEKLKNEMNKMKDKHQNSDNLLLEGENEQKRLKNELDDAMRTNKTFYHEIKKQQIENDKLRKIKNVNDCELRDLKLEHKHISLGYESVVNDLKRLQAEIDEQATICSSKELAEKDKKMKYLSDKCANYKNMYDLLMSDYQNVLGLYENVTNERQEDAVKYAAMLNENVGDNERPVTPRPNWCKAMELKLISTDDVEGKSSDDIMCLLTTKLNQLEQKLITMQSIVTDDQLKELQIKDDDMFMMVDYDETTPKYLKYRGKLRKRRMLKRDIEKLIADIWRKKYANKTNQKAILENYLFDYFKCEYGIQSRVVETGYSMLAALERYRYDADCELFLTILNGELSEDVYRDQKRFLERLQVEFEVLDKKRGHNKRQNETLSKVDIESLIRKMCPAKSKKNMKVLMNALDLNDPNKEVRYKLLFKEDRDGNQGPFVEELRDQHLSEIQDFLKEITENLELKQNEYKQVTVEQIEEIFHSIDPSKAQSEINKYLCVGFGVSMVNSLAKDLLVSTDTYYKKLSTILVKRTGAAFSHSSRNSIVGTAEIETL